MPPRQRLHDLGDDTGPPPSVRRIASEAELSGGSDASSSSSNKEYRIRKSSLIGMIDWTHVLGTHAPQLLFFGILFLLAQLLHQVVRDLREGESAGGATSEIITVAASAVLSRLHDLCLALLQYNDQWSLFSPAIKVTALLLLSLAYVMQRQTPVYLLSFATFQPPDSWKLSHDDIVDIMGRQGCFSDESLSFLRRILERSGTGQATAWPPGIIQCLDGMPADRSMDASRKEAETIIFDVVGKALRHAKVHPRDIDILVINCSLFSPTPSLCAMVASHFGMRDNVATYNLSGMGCSASLISIDLAKKLLSGRNRAKALVVSTEILTPNFYHGNDRGFLIQNTLFRCGGAAMVLSNSWFDGRRAWYKLLHTVRVQGTDDTSYGCVYEGEDATGERGVRLSKDIVKVAGKCMEKNFTTLGPSVLPLTEQAMVVATIAARLVLKRLSKALRSNGREDWALRLPTVKPYVPDFKTGIDHFCIHAGGRAVIDGIENNMKLEPFHTEPSRMTLYNYGNTSSSSIWYELEYIQEHQTTNRLKKGDRILQVAFGSGFKCTSGVWLKL